MYFESRFTRFPTSEPYSGCAKLFLAGQAKKARATALQLRRTGARPAHPADYLLCAEISRAGGFELEAAATLRLGRRHFPGVLALQLAWAGVLAAQGRLMGAARSAYALLKPAPTGREAREQALVLAFLASVYGRMELASYAAAHAAQALETAQAADAQRDPRIWYLLATAAMSLRRWDEAIERGERAVELAPNWPRARIFLAESYMARGHVAKADQLLAAILSAGVQDAGLELVGGLQAWSRGEPETALRLLLSYEYSWSQEQRPGSVRELLPLLPWPADLSTAPQLSAILASLARRDPETHRQLVELPADRRRKVLPVPAVRQEHLLCLPTSVAMASTAQGTPLHPRELFEAMTGRHGTLMWRAVDEMVGRGFEAHWIDARPEGVRALIDQGVPLVGMLEGLFMGHVEVVSGYDEGLGVFYLRDPESWFPGILRQEELEKRYAPAGGGLLALVPPSRRGQVEVRPEWRAPGAAALVALEKAHSLGDREAAEAAYRTVGETSPAGVRRDSLAQGIVLTPKGFQQAMEKHARSDSIPKMARVQALMIADSPALLEEVFPPSDGEVYPLRNLKRLLGLHRLRVEGRWADLLAAVESLLERMPQEERLWIQRCEALAQMGRETEAKEASALALDLAPDSAQVRRAVRKIFPTSASYDENLREIQSLVERYPFDNALKEDLAAVLLDGADGRQYERAELECQRYFPRQPESYARLAVWYLNQGRTDLAGECLGRGRSLIGEEELPLWDFEREAGGAEPEPPEADELPQEAELLLIIARREVAEAVAKGKAPPQMPAYSALRKLSTGGQLEWHEKAELIALTLQLTVFVEKSATKVEARVRQRLPASLSGPLSPALRLVLSRCAIERFPRQAALAVQEWARRICGSAATSPPLRFALALTAEICGELEPARKEYQTLAAEQPGYADPLIRLGTIASRHGDFPAGLEAHKKALARWPGNVDSCTAVADLCSRLGRRDEAIRAQRILTEIQPYDHALLADYASLVLDKLGLDRAVAEVQRRAGLHREGALAAVKAFLYTRAERFYEARRTIELHPEAEKEAPFQVLLTRLRCAENDGNLKQVEKLIEQGLAEHPDDLFLLKIKSRRLESRDEVGAYHFYRELLLRGTVDTELAARFLSLVKKGGDTQVTTLLWEAEEEWQEPLAYCLSVALFLHDSLDDLLGVWRWCAQHRPGLVPVGIRVAHILLDEELYEPAKAVTRSLHEVAPTAPGMNKLLTVCFLEENPRQALSNLQKDEDSGSADILFHMGRCHHEMGNSAQAVPLFHQVIQQEPGHVLALARLARLWECPATLYKPFCMALERGAGANLVFFLVGAAEAARNASRPLPEVWFPNAFDRFRLLYDHGEPTEELECLARALSVWFELWGDRKRAVWLRQCADSIHAIDLDPEWPGKMWVPRKPKA